MRASRYSARIGLLALMALTALGALALLWQLRPPQLPQVQLSWSALTKPMSTAEVEEIGFYAGWLILLTLLLLFAWELLDGIARTIGQRHQEELDAFAARVLPRPVPREPRQVRLTPPGKIPFTFERQPGAESKTMSPATAPAVALGGQPAPATPTSPAAVKDDRTPSISILGPLRITGARPRRGRLRTATEQLLVYLVLRQAGATSEELTEAIWPGQDPSKTKPRLWQSAADARKVIGDAFIRDGERYQLDRTQLKIDLDDLERLLTKAQKATDTAGEQQQLEDALALFHGEPLSGTDYPWADADIRHLNARLVDLLGRTGSARLAHGDPHGALQAAERGLMLDEFNESLWRLALQAEHALGMRESVTRRYRELTRTLDEQLGLQPSQETRTVYRQLLGQT